MIRKIVAYFNKRKEMKLRKWCVEILAKYCACGEEVFYTAGRIYKWIKETPESDS